MSDGMSCSIEKEMNEQTDMGSDNISRMAQNRGGWRSRVDALCAVPAPKT
jgi:hypothetical protein